MLERAGFRNVVELPRGKSIVVDGVNVTATHAVHSGFRPPFGPNAEALGFVFEEGGESVYFAGDTDLFDEMAALAGRVDLALLPIWGWGPRLPAGHLNPESAARAVALIEPAVAVPIHWGTMRSVGAKGAGDPHAPARAFKEAVRRPAPRCACLRPETRPRCPHPIQAMRRGRRSHSVGPWRPRTPSHARPSSPPSRPDRPRGSRSSSDSQPAVSRVLRS